MPGVILCYVIAALQFLLLFITPVYIQHGGAGKHRPIVSCCFRLCLCRDRGLIPIAAFTNIYQGLNIIITIHPDTFLKQIIRYFFRNSITFFFKQTFGNRILHRCSEFNITAKYNQKRNKNQELRSYAASKKTLRLKKKQKTKFFSSGGEKNLFCPEKRVYLHPQASMVELVDTHVSGTCAARCAGSSPVRGTTTTPAFKNAGVFLSPRFFAAHKNLRVFFPGTRKRTRKRTWPKTPRAPVHPPTKKPHPKPKAKGEGFVLLSCTTRVAGIVKKTTFVTLTI